MPEMTERKKPGPSPLPEDEKGKRMNFYIGREAILALNALEPMPGGNWSRLVSDLLVKEAKRKGLL